MSQPSLSCLWTTRAYSSFSSAAVQVMSGLSALTRLHVMATYRSCEDAKELIPGCRELATLRSSSLQELCVPLFQVLAVSKFGLRPLVGPALPPVQVSAVKWLSVEVDSGIDEVNVLEPASLRRRILG